MIFQNKILHWFNKYQRPLPWRKHYKPYEVWVSEIMLQQTQMETVLPYFERWMKALPTLASLAKSDEKKVLKLWEGLGYYSRARNIHESAKVIVSKHQGNFPTDFDAILSLKGIGRYTAGAIASIAFNQDKPIVDGNVLRVLSRVYAIKKPIDIEKNKPLYWKLQEKLIPKGKARYFNQALMELGALVCTTQNPSCPLCPVRTRCKAFLAGNPEDYPFRRHRKKIVKIIAGALVLEHQGKYLIRLRPVGKIMGGLWEFPEWKLTKNALMPADLIGKQTEKLARTEFSISPGTIRPLGAIKRNYTYFNESLNVFHVHCDGNMVKPKTQWAHRWASPQDFQKYPFSSAHVKITGLITQTLH
jgi:A/G-specific adenine glycosylase